MEVAAVLKEEEKCDDGRDRDGGERWSFFVCLGKEEETKKGFGRQAAAVGGTATVNAPVTLHIADLSLLILRGRICKNLIFFAGAHPLLSSFL